jgi:hypothetical protein
LLKRSSPSRTEEKNQCSKELKQFAYRSSRSKGLGLLDHELKEKINAQNSSKEFKQID